MMFHHALFIRPTFTIALLALGAILWIPLAAAVGWLVWYDWMAEPDVVSWAVVIVIGGLLVGIVSFLIHYFTTRVVYWAQVGDDVVMRTLFHEVRIPWSQVGRLVHKELAIALPSKHVLKWVTIDGRRFELWARPEQAQSVFRLASEKGLAVNWPGAALHRGLIAAFLGLGLVALGAGLAIDYLVLDTLLHPARQVQLTPRGYVVSIGLAIFIPLIALAGLALGLFHLIRRPLVIRPGLVHVREGDTTHSWSAFLGQYE